MKIKLSNYQFGIAIKKLRTGSGMSQVELSNATLTTQTHICQIERGVVRPSIKLIGKLSKALGATPKQIIALASGAKKDSEIIELIFEYFK